MSGVTQTVGVSANNGNPYTLLFILRNANMQLNTDQQFTKMFVGTLWDPAYIVANRKTGAFSVACAGGIFSAASKGGSAIVATNQSYSTLTGANTQTHPTIQANNVTFSIVPYLSLTTGNSAALTADFFIYGAVLD